MFLNNSVWFRRLASLAIIFGAFVVFYLNVRHYYNINFTEDDSFVSMVYARRLLAGEGLTWTDGVRVEGYSNFLWLLCQAGLARLGMDLFETSRVLGIFGMSLMFLGTILAFWPSCEKSMTALVFVLLALALCQPMAIWAVGGLEASFIVGFLSLGLVVVFHELDRETVRYFHWTVAGLPLGLACLTRPDSPLLVAVISFGIIIVSGVSKKTIAKISCFILIPVICTIGLTAFRLWYFGEWVPNTALVKVPLGFGFQTKLGLNYISQLNSQKGIWLVSSLALPALFFGSRALRKRITLLSTIAISWSSYVVYIGGDCFRGLRFFLPVILVLVWIGGLGLEWFWREIAKSRFAGMLTLIIILVGALLAVFFHLDQKQEKSTAVNKAYHDDVQAKRHGEVLTKDLLMAFGQRDQQPYVSSDSVGIIPYYTGWKLLCSLGLTDKWLARHPPKDPVYKENPGHQLGNGAYVLSREPDLIHLGGFLGRRYGSVYQTGFELQQNEQFHLSYRFVEFSRSDGPIIRIWARFESSAVGVIRSQNQIEVPAYLLDGQGTERLVLSDGLWMPMPAGSSVIARGLRFPAGEWSVYMRLKTDSGLSDIEVRSSEGLPHKIVIEHEQAVDLQIIAISDQKLNSVILKR